MRGWGRRPQVWEQPWLQSESYAILGYHSGFLSIIVIKQSEQKQKKKKTHNFYVLISVHVCFWTHLRNLCLPRSSVWKFMHVTNFISNSPKLSTAHIFLSMWMGRQMWCVHAIEYHSTINGSSCWYMQSAEFYRRESQVTVYCMSLYS